MNRRGFLQSSGAALGMLALGKGVSAIAEPARDGGDGVVLAERGRSLCSIVVNHGAFASAEEASAASEAVDWFGSDPTAAAICTESHAATELRRYLCALMGLDPAEPAHFPIRSDRDEIAGNLIIVGSERSNRQCLAYQASLGIRGDAAVSPGPEGFRVKTVRKKDGVAVLLAGFDRVGTLYAVYDFLGLCGVRWFAPGLSGEVVPRRGDLRLPAIDRAEAPKFAIRGFWAEFFTSEHTYVIPQGAKGNLEFFDWMARNRMNFWNAGERGVAPGEMEKRGLHLTSFAQAIYTLLDPATYWKAHPEWYGLGPDGKRHFPVDPFGYDFCTSNPDMVAEFVKNMVEKLQKEWKYADYVDWVPEDARDRWCTCEPCRKLGSPTDRNLLMAHQIREGLKRARSDGRLNRDVKVNFIIYLAADVIDPPTRPLPDGFDYDGILGSFFPIHRCYVHALDDPACTEFNRPYCDYLKAWRENPFYKGKFIIGEFYNISGFRDLPILFTRVMERDIRYYYENGARAMHYMHVPIANWGPRAVTNYQYARMLWNPGVNVPDLVDEYLRLRYENAFAPMRDFYASLEQAMLNVPAYVSTPAGYNIPAHLNYRGSGPRPGHLSHALHDLADGREATLFPFLHLRMKGEHPPPDDGPSMEDSIRELERCERLMDQTLTLDVSDRVRACILEDEGFFRFGAATVRLYFYLARSTEHPMKSPGWRREMDNAALQAEYLDRHPVGYASVYGGTMGMMRNALEATGVQDVYLKWKAMM